MATFPDRIVKIEKLGWDTWGAQLTQGGYSALSGFPSWGPKRGTESGARGPAGDRKGRLYPVSGGGGRAPGAPGSARRQAVGLGKDG